MPALEWADAVLSLATGSQTAPRTQDLPAAPAQLIAAWCQAAKEPDRPVEEREKVVRALRCCRFTEGHDLILPAFLPLLLENSSPSFRLQVAGGLLQHASSASTQTLAPLSSFLVATVTRALSPLQYQLASAASSTLPRLASTYFRILSALLLKHPSLTQETTALIATTLSTWIHYGRLAGGAASPALSVSAAERGRVPSQGQLAFGVMSAFASPAPASPKRRTRNGSDASTWSRASSVGRQAESESEDEGTRSLDRRRDAAQIRLDALICLRNLATADPKALHKHWSLFLSNSPYLRSRSTLFSLIEGDVSQSVRAQATAALSAMLEDSASYLSIAEDRPTKASFTSLSASVGETVAELHLSLSALLSLPLVAGQTEHRLALLNLAAKLAANAPYGRMKRPLAQGLVKAILPLLDTPAAAASTLNIIAARYISTSSSQPFEWDKLIEAAESLVETSTTEELHRAGWSLLASAVPACPERDWSRIRPRLLDSFSTCSAAVQLARSSFLVALLRTTKPASSALSIADTALLLQAMQHSPHPPVRLLFCEALSLPALSLPDAPLSPWPAAYALVSTDPSVAVRNAACRALGLLVKEPGAAEAAENSGLSLARVVEVLLEQLERSLEGEEPLDVSGVVWAVANCCDALQLRHLSELRATEIARPVLTLLEDGTNDDKTRTNCFRILHALVKLSSEPFCVDGSVLERVVNAVEAGLSHPAAKVRWNAAIACSSLIPALQSAVSAHHSPFSPSVPLFSRLKTALLELLLIDSSYKVRIHAIGALSRAQVVDEFEREKVERASSRLRDEVERGEVPGKERAHADMLMKRLDAFLNPSSSPAAGTSQAPAAVSSSA
ncbi:hypothetical protein JCM10207_004890 [Rhodosporidiobolus poonsookiae]